MIHLLQCVALIEATYKCVLAPVYIDTQSNHLADDLSRNNVVSFLSKVPSAQDHPSPISLLLLNLLLGQEADWTSQGWRH